MYAIRSYYGIHRDKERLETLRLFYVAATRAKHSLHLFGHTNLDKTGNPATPAAGSLLHAVWPALQRMMHFTATEDTSRSVESATRPALRRLPVDWALPPLAKPLPVSLEESRRASLGGAEPRTRFTLSLRTEEGRVVGTAVHLWLERIALDGVADWSRARVATLEPQLRALLVGEGIPAERLAPCVARILAALVNTLDSTRGRWIRNNFV